MATSISVLPVYVAVDVSASMADTAAEIDRILDEIARPTEDGGGALDMIRISYIQFSTDAHVLVSLSTAPATMLFPSRRFGGTTNPATLFILLKSTIARDVYQLGTNGSRVCRPTVLLVTDGQFDAEWGPQFHELTEYDTQTGDGFSCYPFVVPVGVGVCDPDVLRLLAHPPFIAGLADTGSGLLATLAERLSTSFVEIPQFVSAHGFDPDDFL